MPICHCIQYHVFLIYSCTPIHVPLNPNHCKLQMVKAVLDGCARAREMPCRKRISHTETQAAIQYKGPLRRVKAQHKIFKKKKNPVKEIKRESDFIQRHRFPTKLVKRLAYEFGNSPFFEKSTHPSKEGAKNFCNAQFVVSIN